MVSPAISARQAFSTERAARKTRPPRTPLTVRAARRLARMLPSWQGFRTFMLHLAGLGLLSAAAWQISMALGLAAAGVSVLILEALSGGERR